MAARQVCDHSTILSCVFTRLHDAAVMSIDIVYNIDKLLYLCCKLALDHVSVHT